MPRGRPRLSLLEVALILSLIALLLAVFVPTFVRRIQTNKLVEASELLRELHDRAAAYYGTSWNEGLRHCLPPNAGPTPKEPTANPAEVDFFSEDAEGHSSWEALGFQPGRPIRYSYSYASTRDGCDLGRDETVRVLFRARGDLDGDGVRSRFERAAVPRPDGTLKPVGSLHVHQRVE